MHESLNSILFEALAELLVCLGLLLKLDQEECAQDVIEGFGALEASLECLLHHFLGQAALRCLWRGLVELVESLCSSNVLILLLHGLEHLSLLLQLLVDWVGAHLADDASCTVEVLANATHFDHSLGWQEFQDVRKHVLGELSVVGLSFGVHVF